ncbi:hypothetical protein GCM10009741_48910 [Kribbella lupini]|uniref:Uncharacterized protein n=1 Tax=Kribbella lupini TaxID=291602 RepID=A0ABP4M9F1_9ACTN
MRIARAEGATRVPATAITGRLSAVIISDAKPTAASANGRPCDTTTIPPAARIARVEWAAEMASALRIARAA